MKCTATTLRAHLYEMLDHVAQTGQPVEITRDGVELCLMRQPKKTKKRKMVRTLPALIVGDPDALIHVEWPWNEGRDL